jgi:hypothetical protein
VVSCGELLVFQGSVQFIDGFVRALGSQNCDFLMVKTWTNCGECVFVRGSFVIVFRSSFGIASRSGPAAKEKDINRDCIFDGEEIIERPAT